MNKIKQFIFFILIPLGGLLATMWAMVTQNQRLKDELAIRKAKEKFEKTRQKLEEARNHADKKEQEFLDQYNTYRDMLESTRNSGDGNMSGNA